MYDMGARRHSPIDRSFAYLRRHTDVLSGFVHHTVLLLSNSGECQ
jgi:hypothetical protein